MICFSVWKIKESAWFNLSIFSFSILSASSLALASSFILLISVSSNWVEPSILIEFSLPVDLSLADTCKIPLESISNVISIWGIPRGAGIIFSKLNLPKDLLSLAIDLSPCKTWTWTVDWLSLDVENVSLLLVGIVVLASTNLVNTPPNVSIPNESGVTSNNKISVSSPDKTPPCFVAPVDTHVSGFNDLLGSLLNNFFNFSWTNGILEEPPTSKTSSISFASNPEDFKADFALSIVFSIISSTNLSKLDFDKDLTKCLGTLSIDVI